MQSLIETIFETMTKLIIPSSNSKKTINDYATQILATTCTILAMRNLHGVQNVFLQAQNLQVYGTLS